MRKKIGKKIINAIDTVTTLSCSLALSAYIVYYAVFKYKGQPTEDNSKYRS